jgi:Skp family chaperone for outer membrane proteins
MEIRVVDFDVLTKNYKNYQDGVNEMTEYRTNFLAKLEPVKTEMEAIIKTVQSGLIMDEKSQKEKEKTFAELQERAMSYDNEFKTTMKQMQNDLNGRVYDELSVLINEWSENNSIDLVMGKMEVVFVTKNNEITEDIINIFKERNLFVEFTETTDVEETTETMEQV